jgi:hypothetical protein
LHEAYQLTERQGEEKRDQTPSVEEEEPSFAVTARVEMEAALQWIHWI